MARYVIGIDFGTDSVRVLLVNALTGEELKVSVKRYTRWSIGKFCEPAKGIFRQHPLDHIESFELAIKDLLKSFNDKFIQNIEGMTVSSTGSTIAAVNREGVPLSCLPEFADNHNAMFVLWKDHSANQEALNINELCKSWETDFSKYSGGIYSSEWFWAKILNIIRVDPKVHVSAYSWIEHCDWFTSLLCGFSDVHDVKRSRCAAGHKAMWHTEFGGLPSDEFLTKLDPRLKGLRKRLYSETYTSDENAGILSKEWSTRLGLPQKVKIGVGLLDAHSGAVGANIGINSLVKVIGTSTCDLINVSSEKYSCKVIKGICGQVDGSIVPGYVGLEAGQSAFGDIFKWFGDLLISPFKELLKKNLDKTQLENLQSEILPFLSRKAAEIPVSGSDPVALDWLNGRRTPDVNLELEASIVGLSLGTNAPWIFKSLVEAASFGSKAILERLQEEGVEIKEVIALGGITKRSEYVMQTLANVLDLEIHVVKSDQACALGAAMLAATACGVYENVSEAKSAMFSGYSAVFSPVGEKSDAYKKLYSRYQKLGNFIDKEME